MNEIAEHNSTVEDLRAFERLFRRDPLVIRNFLINERFKADMELTRKMERDESRKEGMKEAAKNLRSQGILTDEQIAQALNMPIDTVKSL